MKSKISFDAKPSMPNRQNRSQVSAWPMRNGDGQERRFAGCPSEVPKLNWL